MEQMTVSSLVAAFPETKSQIASFVDKMVDDALDGYVSPLKMEAQLACMENVVKGIRSNASFKEAVLTEAEKEGQKTFSMHNAQFQIKETGSKWHYEECNHSEYNRICSQIETLTEKKKAIEKLLQASKQPFIFIDPETGEEMEAKPPFKTSTTSVVTTIAK